MTLSITAIRTRDYTRVSYSITIAANKELPFWPNRRYKAIGRGSGETGLTDRGYGRIESIIFMIRRRINTSESLAISRQA